MRPIPLIARKRCPVYTTGRPYRSRQTPEKYVLYTLPVGLTGPAKRPKNTSCIHYRSALPVPPNARKIRPVYTTGRPYRSCQTPEKDVLYILPVLYRSTRPIPPIAPKRRPLYSTGPAKCQNKTSCIYYPSFVARRDQFHQSPQKDVLYTVPVGLTGPAKRQKKTSCINYLQDQSQSVHSLGGASYLLSCLDSVTS